MGDLGRGSRSKSKALVLERYLGAPGIATNGAFLHSMRFDRGATRSFPPEAVLPESGRGRLAHLACDILLQRENPGGTAPHLKKDSYVSATGWDFPFMVRIDRHKQQSFKRTSERLGQRTERTCESRPLSKKNGLHAGFVLAWLSSSFACWVSLRRNVIDA